MSRSRTPAASAADVGMRAFGQSLPMALLRARDAVMQNFRPTLKEHGLSEQQFRVLRALAAEVDGMLFGALAEATVLLGPSLSRILTTLERDELISRSSVEYDTRRVLVAITETGTGLVSRIGPYSEVAYAAIEDEIGARNLELLYSLLDSITASALVVAGDSRVRSTPRKPRERG